MEDELIISHNAGFFSCSSVALNQIVDYVNIHNRLPSNINRSCQYSEYKINMNDDLIQLLFDDKNTEYNFESIIDYQHNRQFTPYKNLEFNKIFPLVAKYFTPSKSIYNIIDKIENSLNINYDDTIAVCYRGNDKWTETSIATYEEFIDKCESLNAENKTFFLQTDVKEFFDLFVSRFPNTIYNSNIKMINHNPSTSIHYTYPKNSEKRLNHGMNLFASVYVLSKCSQIVTYSGNVGIWICLYRNKSEGIHQYLNGEWV